MKKKVYSAISIILAIMMIIPFNAFATEGETGEENGNSQTSFPTVKIVTPDGNLSYTADASTTTYPVPSLDKYAKEADKDYHYSVAWKYGNVPSGTFGATDESFEIVRTSEAHNFTDVTDPAATCTTAGTITHTCGTCHYEYTSEDPINPNAHAWDEWAIDADSWVTNTDNQVEANNSATANVTRVCAYNASHTETDAATVTVTDFTASTVKKGGSVTFTATYNDVVVGTKTEEFQALPHNHAWSAEKVATGVRQEATCTAVGYYEVDYQCTGCNEFKGEAENVEIPAKNHDFTGAIDINWTQDGDDWTATGVQHCKNDASHTTPVNVVTVDKVVTPAEKGNDGSIVWTAKVDGIEQDSKTEIIHNWGTWSIDEVSWITNTDNQIEANNTASVNVIGHCSNDDSKITKPASVKIKKFEKSTVDKKGYVVFKAIFNNTVVGEKRVDFELHVHDKWNNGVCGVEGCGFEDTRVPDKDEVVSCSNKYYLVGEDWNSTVTLKIAYKNHIETHTVESEKVKKTLKGFSTDKYNKNIKGCTFEYLGKTFTIPETFECYTARAYACEKDDYEKSENSVKGYNYSTSRDTNNSSRSKTITKFVNSGGTAYVIRTALRDYKIEYSADLKKYFDYSLSARSGWNMFNLYVKPKAGYFDAGNNAYVTIKGTGPNGAHEMRIYLKYANLPQTKISLKKQKKAIAVTCNKMSGITGYQIQYSLKKNLKSSKYKTFKNYKGTLKKLKSKKKYYVRVRAYKIIYVDGKANYVYGPWSAVKSVKTK